jgi:hypothetical protein
MFVYVGPPTDSVPGEIMIQTALTSLPQPHAIACSYRQSGTQRKWIFSYPYGYERIITSHPGSLVLTRRDLYTDGICHQKVYRDNPLTLGELLRNLCEISESVKDFLVEVQSREQAPLDALCADGVMPGTTAEITDVLADFLCPKG